MNNHTNYINRSSVDTTGTVPEILRDFWLSGIVTSCIGLGIQFSYYTFVPVCRKYDEKVLTMMTAARLINTILEYTIIINTDFDKWIVQIRFIINVLYFQSDFALVCWMFVLSKNLYDKVVLVFSQNRFNLTAMSCVIWTLTFLNGLVPGLLLIYNFDAFLNYFYVYVCVKFVLVIVNALIFVKIFAVACTKGSHVGRNISHYVRAAIVSFILLCITSLHVLVTDLFSMLANTTLPHVVEVFFVINSFQIVLITSVFLILARKKVKDSSFRNSSVRTREIST